MSLATRIAQEFNNVRSHISGITATHLLGGNLSVSNEVITNGFSTTLYTGNGGAQAINTGVDMATQWGNYTSEQFGGLVWLKSRSVTYDNYFVDTVRGATKDIYSNATTNETTEATGLTSFTSTGFNLGTLAGMNTNLATYASWNFQTTHRRTGVTNHGKAYTEHYNPFTGFTIIKYEGSGIAGHEIPHSLGRKLGFVTVKNLSGIQNWIVSTNNDYNNVLILNATNLLVSNSSKLHINDDSGNDISIGTDVTVNTSANQYIMYGWANSYLDESNKLIGNYEVGVYQGTGAAGNKVTTRGKPAWVMVKRLDGTGNWLITDNLRNSGDNLLIANGSNAEFTGTDYFDYVSDGFIQKTTTVELNASGGQYLYMVVYDNYSGSGKSKYPKATDTSNVQINNALIPLAQGIDSNGSKNSIVIANETITGLTYTQGKNYLYKTDTGYGVKPYEPRYLSSELVRRFAGEQPDYYDVNTNKWFNTDAGSELVVNGKFDVNTSGWTVSGGGTLISSNGYGLVTVNTGTSFVSVEQNITIENKQHIIFFTGSVIADTNNNTSGRVLVKITQGSNIIYSVWHWYNNVGNVIIPLSGITGNINIKFLFNYNTGTQAKYRIDNISVFPTDILPTEITESRNYLNHIVHADQNGQPTFVEELPKIEYKNIIKANKYLGSNAVSLSVAFDLTTTPITIKGKIIGAKALIRTSAGVVDIYLDDDLKGIELKLAGITNGNQVRVLAITDNKITIETSNSSGTATSYTYTSINGVGNEKIL